MRRFSLSLLLIFIATSRVQAQPKVPPVSALRPELALQIGHNLPVTCVAFSPDGRTLASGSRDTTIKLWDVASGGVRRTLSGIQAVVKSVAFSPDGRWLAEATSGGGVGLWDVGSGKEHRHWREPESSWNCLAYAPNGRWLATGGIDGVVTVWNPATGKAIHRLKANSDSVQSVAFSPDGGLIASGSMNRVIKLWDANTAVLRRTLPEQSAMIASLAFSPDSRFLASGSEDEKENGSIKLWDVATGKVRRSLVGHKDMVLSVAFSADGKQLASCSRDNTIKWWDVGTGQVQHSVDGKGANAVALSPDGNFLAASDEDKTVQLWDADTAVLARTLAGQQNLATSVAFSPDGKTLANSSWDQTVKLWDMETGAERRTLTGDDSQVESVKFSPDGKLIASHSYDKTINLWDAATGSIVRVLRGHDSWVTSIAFSPDSTRLASCSDDGSLKIWNVGTGAVLRTLHLTKATPEIVAYSPDGKTLACTGSDDVIRVFDAATGAVRRTLRGQQLSLTSLAYSPDGKMLASGSVDQTIRLYDPATGKVRHSLEVDSGVATDVAFSPDSATLASVGANAVTLWDTATGKRRRILRGHENLVLGVAFSPDGKRLVSASSDTTIKLWEPSSGRLLATLLTLPEIDDETLKARPLSIGAKPLSIGAKALSIGAKALSIGAKAVDSSDEWFISTPSGWFDCSANAAQFIRWNIGDKFVPAERYYRRLRRPDLVQQTLRGGSAPLPDLTNQDVPPVAQFTRVLYDGQDAGQEQAKSIRATLEVQGRRDFKEVIVLVNGRPLPPEAEQPLEVSDVAVDLAARPLSIGAKPLTIGAKALSIGAKALSIGAKPLAVGAKPVDATGNAVPSAYSVAKRYTFQIPLPEGAREIRLRALAYDSADIGSNPAELVLSRPDAKPVSGNLYILCAGIGRYKNGTDGPVVDPKSFSNLKFPGDDAQAIAARLHQEGAPLYDHVELYDGAPLVDEQATLDNLRQGLKWLQQKGQPGQMDTIMVFLSGHGLSDPQGRYYFPTYGFDKANWKETSLSGEELQQALGGKVRARAVFLFVDTCHSGALAGARNDDLNFEVNNSGVYMIASSSASQYSYESDKWGHGAFTLALLRSFSRSELVQSGSIRFNVLTYAVPDEITRLMNEAGQNETAMAPVVPLEGRKLDEPVVQVEKDAK